ncbi:MAG TPA: A24 family peptidase [Phycisphaerales bacterium]|nr:A24 family peptidase [Phycisphaerales bacterium]
MNHHLLMGLFTGVQVLFAFAFGACIGSLTNVLVYRMPRNLSVVRPASRCPGCEHVLTWRENIPVLGWVLLRGKCRFCKAPISPEYPLVEAFVGLVFVLFYTLWYIVPDSHALWLGFDWSAIKPEWAENGWTLTWPVFVTLLALVSSLIAMTIIDARTFTIPLALAWAPTLLAFVAHPAWAAVLPAMGRTWRHTAPGEWWAIPTPGPHGWPLLCASLGGLAGLLIAVVLLATGLLRRSFADYDEWEEKTFPLADGATPAASDVLARAEVDPPIAPFPHPPAQAGAELINTEVSKPRAPREGRVLAIVAALALVGLLAGGAGAARAGFPAAAGAIAGLLIAIPVAGPLIRLARGKPGGTAAPGEDGSPAEMWIQYPHARREVLRELLFLAPCLGLGVLGWYAGLRFGAPWTAHPMTGQPLAATPIPMWLSALGGVALGYLVGGGIVWGIRIFGTLGFGREAMGLGDVHLLAAVGACLGWIDAVLAFFLAPFMALYMVVVQAAWTGGGRRAMPYGPYLAVATLAVVLGKPAIELALTAMFSPPEPINIP